MHFVYGPDDLPKPATLLSLGAAWTIIAASFVIILGCTISSACHLTHLETLSYIQKLMLITGAAIILQILAGHRLPAMFGPSAILLVAALSCAETGPSAFYTSMILCAALCALLSWTPLLRYIQKLFTPRVTGTILLLISVCTLPTILNLLFNPGEPGSFAAKIAFTLIMLLALFIAGRFLKGWFKATMYLWALIVGGTAAVLILGNTFTPPALLRLLRNRNRPHNTRILPHRNDTLPHRLPRSYGKRVRLRKQRLKHHRPPRH